MTLARFWQRRLLSSGEPPLWRRLRIFGQHPDRAAVLGTVLIAWTAGTGWVASYMRRPDANPHWPLWAAPLAALVAWVVIGFVSFGVGAVLPLVIAYGIWRLLGGPSIAGANSRPNRSRRAEPVRPARGQPYPLTQGATVTRDEGGRRWWTEHDGWWWRLDHGAASWQRGDPLPVRAVTGDTRDATWALTQHELLRRQNRLIEEQNRLLVGGPPPELPAIFAL